SEVLLGWISSTTLEATFPWSVRSCSSVWAAPVRKRSVQVLASLCDSFSRRAVVDALLDAKPLSQSELELLVDEWKRSPQAPRRAAKKRADGSPAGRIQRVLISEAGLSVEQSIVQLRTEIKKTTSVPLPSDTGSLRVWLKDALEVVPAG